MVWGVTLESDLLGDWFLWLGFWWPDQGAVIKVSDTVLSTVVQFFVVAEVPLKSYYTLYVGHENFKKMVLKKTLII